MFKTILNQTIEVEDDKFPLIVKERQGNYNSLDEEYDFYRLTIGFFKDYPLPKAIPETQISGIAYELVRNRHPDCWHYDAEENFWNIEPSPLGLISLIKQEVIQTLIENNIDPIVGKKDDKKEIEIEETSSTTDELLTGASLLHRIGLKLEKQGYIGETSNKLATYLAGTTKDYQKEERISIISKGESGGGKSTIVINILERYFADYVKSFHRMTKHAPDYWAKEIGTLDGKILLLKQMEGTEETQYTVEIMVDPVSGGLKILTTSGTPDDRKTEEIALPGIPVMGSTTVRLKLDQQLIRRFYTIYPDETPEQTKKIMKHKAKMQEDPSYRTIIKLNDQDLIEIPNKLKTESATFGIVIPFAGVIAEDKFPPESLLARSDIDKFFNFIKACTHLYYKQRLSYMDNNGNVQLIASPVDYYYAWQIVKVSLPKRLSGISDERSYKILTIVQKECLLRGSTDIDSVMKIAYTKGIPSARNTIWHSLDALRDKGYVKSETNPDDKRKLLWGLTGKSYEPFNISFPDKKIEDTYIQFIADNIGNRLGGKHWELLRKSMNVFDLQKGADITANIVSEKTRTMLKL